MASKSQTFYFGFALVMFSWWLVAPAQAQNLASFAVLAGSTVTNTGPSVITGNVGVSPGTAIVGFPPAIINAPYTIHAADAVAAAAQDELTTAYNFYAGRPFNIDLTGQDLGGLTLVAGVYNFDVSAGLTGDLTLDGQGSSNSIFIFNVGSTLDTAAGSRILLINNANPNNVYFRVGSSATLLAGTQFVGKIIALTSITLTTGASINCGAALARNGAVTLDTNVIGICPLLAMSVGGGLDDTATDNDTALAAAIDAFITAGGTLPLSLQVLSALTPEELATALTQLSGETATGSSTTVGQGMDSFLDLLGDRSGPQAGNVLAPPRANTVSVMGYAASPATTGGSAFSGFDAGPAMPDIDQWDVWASSYGSMDFTAGDALAGTVGRNSAAYGLALGWEHRVSADSMLGFALSGGGTNFNLNDSLGSGHSAMVQAAAYGRVESDAAYVSGAMSYAIHDMHTDRYVTFAGVDHYAAQFLTQDIAGQVEAGYHMNWFTPFAALRGQYVMTPAYEETTVSGSSSYALGHPAGAALSASTQIGGRARWSAKLEAGSISLSASAAWAHSFDSGNTVNSYFLTTPGIAFSVQGAAPAADAIVVSLGAGLALDSGFSLSSSLNGRFAENAQSYAASAGIGYTW
jgi:uncharacterized protein with beta-barrel porin domain